MYFPSKKDLWLTILYWGTIILCVLPFFIEPDVIAILIMLPIQMILIWFWFTTGYLITGDQLIIKFGPVKKRIPIQDISRMRRTKNPLSAPALSMDRIEILYGKYGMTLVSPREAKRFVTILMEINPHIHIDEGLTD